jgi:trehalose/maltose hydrolase-like predicted phosphorylase
VALPYLPTRLARIASLGVVNGANAEKIVIPAKAGIQGFDFAGFCFWQTRFF